MNTLERPHSDRSPGLLTQLVRRVAFVTIGAALVVASLFFITVALVAGALLAGGLLLRWWWVMRRLRARARGAAPLEGEYRVVPAAQLGPTRDEG